jgi:hypothetical protein
MACSADIKKSSDMLRLFEDVSVNGPSTVSAE